MLNMTRMLSQVAPKGVDYISLRRHRDQREAITVRDDVLLPMQSEINEGIMVTVHQGRGIGYGATTDMSLTGIKQAVAKACRWAELQHGVHDFSQIKMPTHQDQVHAPEQHHWTSVPLNEKIDYVHKLCSSLKKSLIHSRETSLLCLTEERELISSLGGHTYKTQISWLPSMIARASDGKEFQTRTYKSRSTPVQGGFADIIALALESQGPKVAEEAIVLLKAAPCQEGTLDIIVDPDQMLLQIHESIGHPLELDRILGDERNYAGTSFVTKDMFGRYQYGSKLLNVTFDPTPQKQLASYAFDDEGMPAKKVYLIKDGVLMNPIGGAISQARAEMKGVACARSVSWDRPAIDRMGNINLEPGTAKVPEMIARTRRGIYLKTNSSWSIDDQRNKFQFSCEWGQMIENGKLTQVVKNPCYRGISANFWRSLAAVADHSSFEVLGTLNCGKGEPNQAIHVGHASPACLFKNVDVFGGV